MIDSKTAQKILNRILSSEQFSSSDFDKELLSWLVQSALDSRKVKETTIAIEVFGKSHDFDPSSDSIVRSHIYSLRKKLDVYYLTDGKSDKFRLSIPKGHYKAEFIKQQQKLNTSQTFNVKTSLCYISLILLIGTTTGLFYTLHKYLEFKNHLENHTSIDSDNDLIKPFLKSSKPLILTYGDYFGFYEKLDSHPGNKRVRISTVNTEADLQVYLKKNPDAQLKATDIRTRFIGNTSIEIVSNILTYYKLLKPDFQYKPTSLLQDDDFQNNNILYIGPLKSVDPLEPFIEPLNYKTNLVDYILIHKEDPNQQLERILTEDFESENIQFERDYGIIARLPMTGTNNTLLLLSTFGPNGLNTVVKAAESGKFIKMIQEKYLNNSKEVPFYFEAVIKISNVDNEFYFEIIDFKNLDT